jgi:predicted Zn-dependent peptidase
MKPALTYHGELPILTDRAAFDNGLVSVSVTFRNGSVSETEANNGVSHFIEHLVFRGTRKYTFEEISKETERLGGYLNAYTTKEQTTFYINGFADNLSRFMDILLDISFFPNLTEDDFLHEKKVILNEIASLKDSPEEYIDEAAEAMFFKNHPLALPISGTEASVRSIGIDELRRFYTEKYRAGSCIISVAGNADASDIIRSLDDCGVDVYAKGTEFSPEPSPYSVFNEKLNLNVEQAYVQYMFPCCTALDDERFELSAVNMILGGLMSSRLFQEVREKRGLCYNIETDMNLYKFGGANTVFFSCDRENLDAVEMITVKEIERIAKEGISEAELELAVNQMLYSFCSGMETTGSRMFANLRQVFYLGKQVDSAAIKERIKKVSRAGVNLAAEKYFSQEGARCLILP